MSICGTCQIYVVDSSDEARMDESGEELNNLLAEEKLAGIPLLVYANKQDLDLAEPEDVVSTRSGLISQLTYSSAAD